MGKLSSPNADRTRKTRGHLIKVKPRTQVPVFPLPPPNAPFDFPCLPSNFGLPTFSARIHQSQAPAANPGPVAPARGNLCYSSSGGANPIGHLLPEFSASSAVSPRQRPDNKSRVSFAYHKIMRLLILLTHRAQKTRRRWNHKRSRVRDGQPGICTGIALRVPAAMS